MRCCGNTRLRPAAWQTSRFWAGILSCAPRRKRRPGSFWRGRWAPVGCLYFLSLSTPVPELLDALRRARVPEVVGDLAVLIYRYIFILFATFRSMRDAAASRLGYAGPVRSLRTTGRVYGGLLAHSFRRAQACFDAMESRCYDGGIRFLTREKPRARAARACVRRIDGGHGAGACVRRMTRRFCKRVGRRENGRDPSV